MTIKTLLLSQPKNIFINNCSSLVLLRGCSSARLERHAHNVDVTSSNLATRINIFFGFAKKTVVHDVFSSGKNSAARIIRISAKTQILVF